MFKFRKSQVAMEFIMNYGWAILAVLIIIVGLVYFGLLDTEKFVPEKTDLPPGLTVVDAAADQDSIVFIFKNDIGKTLFDFQVNVTKCKNGKGALTEPVNVAAGQTKKLSIFCGATSEPGEKFKSDIKVNYSTKEAGEMLTHAKKGTFATTVTRGSQSYASRYLKKTISGCQELNEEYTHYVLTGHATLFQAQLEDYCFDITEDNIILDLNSFSITYESGLPGGTIGINVDSRINVTIMNGCISRFASGIKMYASNSNTISGIKMNSNWNGISFENSSNNNVDNSTICNEGTLHDFISDSNSHDTGGSDNKFISSQIDRGGNLWPTLSDYDECAPLEGSCATAIIECAFDDDCGIDSTEFYCDDLVLMVNTTTYDCVNPSTIDSYCDVPVVTSNIASTCNYICSSDLGCDYTNCSDGIDNDGDGYCDAAGSTCSDGSIVGDLGCDDFYDIKESDRNSNLILEGTVEWIRNYGLPFGKNKFGSSALTDYCSDNALPADCLIGKSVNFPGSADSNCYVIQTNAASDGPGGIGTITVTPELNLLIQGEDLFNVWANPGCS